jgi:carbonic anhydrase/acetyltransferase-like protein (isoleucine patch superfamily)
MTKGFENKFPVCGKGVYIDETATVIGDVIIGDDSSVWPGAVIRGDVAPIRIGKRTNIQDCCVVHVSGTSKNVMMIGDGVTIGHGAIIHSCSIGDGVLVGIGSIILDGAVIGNNSIIAAGSLVTKGTVFPERSIIAGSPAVRVRDVSDDEIIALDGSVQRYVDLKNRYISDV